MPKANDFRGSDGALPSISDSAAYSIFLRRFGSTAPILSEQLLHDLAVDVREAEVASLESVCELGVIKAQ